MTPDESATRICNKCDGTGRVGYPAGSEGMHCPQCKGLGEVSDREPEEDYR